MTRFCLLLIILHLLSCTQDQKTEPDDITTILHLSHTRASTQGKIKDNLLAIPFQNYDILCLGGDLDVQTSLNIENMNSWNDLFDFGRSETLWSLGNHDIMNTTLIEQFTKRPTFYSWNYKDITFLVLNTELAKGTMNEEQLALLQHTRQNMGNSKYLIVLSHRLIWMPGNEVLEPQIDSIANGPFGDCGFCTSPNNFYEAVYPELILAKAEGAQVICVAGDIGFNVGTFEYQTTKGISLLSSGINNVNPRPNKALVLEVNHTKQTIHWTFKLLEDL